jgi:tetratricopeptide (TPR) repeat protein
MAKQRTKIPRKNKTSIEDDTLLDLTEVKDSAQGFFEKNQKAVVGIAALLALLVAAYVVYQFLYKAPQETAAKEMIYKAEQQFLRDSFALALENPGGGFEGFLDIIDNYSGTKTANLAKYYAGVSYLNLGNNESAIEYLSSFSAAGDVTPTMRYGALGDAYSEMNDYDAALSNYKKAAYGTANELLSPYYLKKYGMLCEVQGDMDSAQKAYAIIQEKYPNSAEGSDIEKYLN